MDPIIPTNRPGNVQKLQHWNRRAWQELSIIKTRLEILEKEIKVETGGDYEFAPEGDPWEQETVYIRDKGMVIFAFLLGVLVGAAIILIFTVR